MTTSHLNLRFSLKDMDDVERWARNGMLASSIAMNLSVSGKAVSTHEVMDLCKRNGIQLGRRA